MIQNERASRHEHVLDVARQMMTAARTAPKGKGVDIIEIAMVTGDDLRLSGDACDRCGRSDRVCEEDLKGQASSEKAGA